MHKKMLCLSRSFCYFLLGERRSLCKITKCSLEKHLFGRGVELHYLLLS